MLDIPTLLVLADISGTVGVFLAVIIILAVIVLLVSIWLYRKSIRRRCPYCHAVVLASDQVCPNCGKELPAATPTTLTGV
jgi:hypothetical protein